MKGRSRVTDNRVSAGWGAVLKITCPAEPGPTFTGVKARTTGNTTKNTFTASPEVPPRGARQFSGGAQSPSGSDVAPMLFTQRGLSSSLEQSSTLSVERLSRTLTLG